MRVIYTLNEMVETARGWLAAGAVGFIPTEGNIRTEHLALVKKAQEECAISIVSIFANPLQSSPPGNEPSSYPQTLTQDLNLLRQANVDVVFVPRAKDMYPATFSTYIIPSIVRAEHLQRLHMQSVPPAYISGFATVIIKLFQIIRPDVAYFRQTDMPEVAIVQKVVQDLNIDIALRFLSDNTP